MQNFRLHEERTCWCSTTHCSSRAWRFWHQFWPPPICFDWRQWTWNSNREMRSGRSCSSRKYSQKRFQRLEVQVELQLLQLLIINMAHVRRRDEKEVLARYQDLIKVNMISVIDLVLGAPQNCSPMLATTQSQNLPKKMPPLYLMNTKWFDAPNSSKQEKNFVNLPALGSTYCHSSCFITQKCACVRWVIANLILSWFTEAIFTLKKLWKNVEIYYDSKKLRKKAKWYFIKARNGTTFLQ